MHARFSPRSHRFVYRLFLFAIDLDELASLHRRLPFFSVERANLYAYRDRDYLPTHEDARTRTSPSAATDIPGDRPGPQLKARVLAHLAAQGIQIPGARVLLVTLPRIAGYLFNPVSFYFCYDRGGEPVAAIAEVTNTFREVKPYVLGPDTRRGRPAHGAAPLSFQRRVPKHFYVSPFSDVDVAFDFTLAAPGNRLQVQIDDYAGAERTLASTLHGAKRELTAARLAWYSLKYPLLTLRIIALIHWHALQLWLKRVPWYPKAARAADQRELFRPHASLSTSTTHDLLAQH